MKKNDDNDFRNFWAFKFATEVKQWEPWMNWIAKDYYLSFLENNDILLELIAPYLNRKKAELSKKESFKLNILLNLFDFFKSITYDEENKTVHIKTEILDPFNQVISEDKILLIKNSRYDLINDASRIENEQIKLDSFKMLIKKSNLFINFYKNSEAREVFFREVIVKNNLEVLNSMTPILNENIKNYAIF